MVGVIRVQAYSQKRWTLYGPPGLDMPEISQIFVWHTFSWAFFYAMSYLAMYRVLAWLIIPLIPPGVSEWFLKIYTAGRA